LPRHGQRYLRTRSLRRFPEKGFPEESATTQELDRSGIQCIAGRSGAFLFARTDETARRASGGDRLRGVRRKPQCLGRTSSADDRASRHPREAYAHRMTVRADAYRNHMPVGAMHADMADAHALGLVERLVGGADRAVTGAAAPVAVAILAV